MSRLSIAALTTTDSEALISDLITSARRFKIPLHIGYISATAPRSRQAEGITNHIIPRQQNLARAKYYLLGRVKTDYILWLNSSERLFAFPEISSLQFDQEFYFVRLRPVKDLTPCFSLRLHHRKVDIKKLQAIEASPTGFGSHPFNSDTLLPNILIEETDHYTLSYPNKNDASKAVSFEDSRYPLKIDSQLARLTKDYRTKGKIDEERLEFLFQCLSNGIVDPESMFPSTLLGADRQTLTDHIQQSAIRWNTSESLSASEISPSNDSAFFPVKARAGKPAPELSCRAPLAVCILSHGNQDETNRAVESARFFDLPVYIGLTRGDLEMDGFEEVRIFDIPWQDNFSASRNQLLEFVESRYVLWLDSDETLFSLPQLDWAAMDADIYLVQLQFYLDKTPILSPRLHRNHSGLTWKGRVHELLYKTDGTDVLQNVPLFHVVLRHDGYEDPERLKEKHRRNAQIADGGLNKKRHAKGEWLSRLIWENISGKHNLLHWLRFFKWMADQAKSTSARTYCAIAAETMCSSGYTTPARRLLAQAPLQIHLHMTLLAGEFRLTGKIDDKRLAFIVKCLQNGCQNPMHAISTKLLGADTHQCRAYIDELIEEWAVTPKIIRGMEEHRMNLENKSFIRTKHFDSETFEDDLLLMNRETRETIVLNQMGALLWQALLWPHSTEDLCSLMEEALPAEDKEEISSHVEKLMQTLWSTGLIVEA